MDSNANEDEEYMQLYDKFINKNSKDDNGLLDECSLIFKKSTPIEVFLEKMEKTNNFCIKMCENKKDDEDYDGDCATYLYTKEMSGLELKTFFLCRDFVLMFAKKTNVSTDTVPPIKFVYTLTNEKNRVKKHVVFFDLLKKNVIQLAKEKMKQHKMSFLQLSKSHVCEIIQYSYFKNVLNVQSAIEAFYFDMTRSKIYLVDMGSRDFLSNSKSTIELKKANKLPVCFEDYDLSFDCFKKFSTEEEDSFKQDFSTLVNG